MNRNKLLIAISVGCLAIPLPAFTQDEEGSSATGSSGLSASVAIADRFYVSPMATYTLADSDRGTKNGLGGTVAIGKQFQQRFAFELAAHYASFKPDANGADSAKLVSGAVRGLLFPTSGGLYGLAGLGYGRFKDHPGLDPDYRSILWTVGMGYLVGPFDLVATGVSLRAEVAFRSDMHRGELTADKYNNALNEGVASLGLLIPIGAGPAPVAAPAPLAPEPEAASVEVVPVVAPTDTDGDGVTDDADQCPDTPPGTAVDATGCPLPEPTPPPVADCQSPENGAPVSLKGCKAGDKIVLRGVTFEFDRANLVPNAKTILDQAGDALLSAQNIRVEIAGHTDARGSDAYNSKLSNQRAQSVMNYLTERGIAADRMSAKGYGESEPVADNETDEGRELNRRVELKILE